jgi:hypothetical protein
VELVDWLAIFVFEVAETECLFCFIHQSIAVTVQETHSYLSA